MCLEVTSYYDPGTGRFVNADGYVSTGQGVLSTNMFVYCNNNPVMYSDSTVIAKTVTGSIGGYSGFTLTGSVMSIPMRAVISPPTPPASPKTTPTRPSVGNSGGGSTSTMAIYVRDVTREVNKVLAPYVAMAQEMRKLANAMPLYESYIYGSFGLLVNHGGAWDIKRPGPWENTIGTPFPGDGAMISYRGMVMTPEALGNYTYGYLGAAFGISYQTLTNGSVFAAYSGGSMKNPGGFYDEAGDWNYIALGYLDYYF